MEIKKQLSGSFLKITIELEVSGGNVGREISVQYLANEETLRFEKLISSCMVNLVIQSGTLCAEQWISI